MDDARRTAVERFVELVDIGQIGGDEGKLEILRRCDAVHANHRPAVGVEARRHGETDQPGGTGHHYRIVRHRQSPPNARVGYRNR